MLNVKKLLKKIIKRKVKITDALIISFLISGNIIYGLEIEGNFINDKIIEEIVIVQSDNINLINNGTIINPYNQSENMGQGNAIYSNQNLINVENNGIIFGSIIATTVDETLTPSGNGILLNTPQLENLKNTGVIKGNVETKAIINKLDWINNHSGNGIMIDGYLKNITNSGIIFGKSIATVNGVGRPWYAGNSISSIKTSGYKVPINLINSGLISGYSFAESIYTTANTVGASTQFHGSGNGFYSFFSSESTTNYGIISGQSEGYAALDAPNSLNPSGYIKFSGNGIYSGEGIKNINNKGIISGYLRILEGNLNFNNYADYRQSGNGIIIGSENSDSSDRIPVYIENPNFLNEGVISGYGEIILKNTVHYNSTFAIGSGVSIDASFNEIILNNTGLIKGTYSALSFFNDTTAFNSIVNNYGILSGNGIFRNVDGSWRWDGNPELSPINTNYGSYIYLTSEYTDNKRYEIMVDSNGNPIINKIDLGIGGLVTINGIEKNVINGSTTGVVSSGSRSIEGNVDLFVNSSNLNENSSNLIINGVGRETGALTVNSNISLENSTINGYETALYIKENQNFIGENVIFNGGGLKNDIAIIKGDNGDNTMTILGNSVINGITDLGDGNDRLTLANSVQINGELNGNLGINTLNLGQNVVTKTASNLNILHNISGFESINTNGNVTLFETISVTDAEKIILESGNLILRVDPTKIMDGKVIGHALYKNNGKLSSTGGKLIIGLNGLGGNTIISTGGTKIDTNINDFWWKPSDYLTTNSLVLDAKLQDDGNIFVTIKESLPLEPSNPLPPDPPVNPEEPKPPINPSIDPGLYKELNKVYESIVNAGQIGELANTTLLEDKTFEEALGGLLTILDQIYANNPYTYSLKSSRDSLKLFENNLSYLTIKPKESEWIVQGKGFYSDVKNDNFVSGKGCYGFDTAHRNYKTTTSFGGGLATAEYGLTSDSSIGFVLGGGNQNTDFKGSSKIKGNSLYLGVFTKKEINQFKFMSGIGYQYGSLKGERVVTNKYNYFKTGDTYDVNSFSAFSEAKYDYSLNNTWIVSPKAKLSWYYISQDSVNEGYEPGNLSLKVNSAAGNTGDLEIGLDLKNTLTLNSGILNNIFSVGVINTLGNREKDLTSNIFGAQKDGTDFNIQGVKLPRTSGKLSYNLEYEKINGMIYTFGIGYQFAKKNNLNLTGTIGINYKF